MTGVSTPRVSKKTTARQNRVSIENQNISSPSPTLVSQSNNDTNINTSVPVVNTQPNIIPFFSDPKFYDGGSVTLWKQLFQPNNIREDAFIPASSGSIELNDFVSMNDITKNAFYEIGVRNYTELYDLYAEPDRNKSKFNYAYIRGAAKYSNKSENDFLDLVADLIYAHPKRPVGLTKNLIKTNIRLFQPMDFKNDRENDFRSYLTYLNVGKGKDNLITIQSPGALLTIQDAKDMYSTESRENVHIGTLTRTKTNLEKQNERNAFLNYQIKDIIGRSGVVNPLGENVFFENYMTMGQDLKRFMQHPEIKRFYGDNFDPNNPTPAQTQEVGDAILKMLSTGEIMKDKVFGLKLNNKDMIIRTMTPSAVRIGMTQNTRLLPIAEKHLFDYLQQNTTMSYQELQTKVKDVITTEVPIKGYRGFRLHSGSKINDNMRFTGSIFVQNENEVDDLLEVLSTDPVTGFTPIGFEPKKRLNLNQYNVFLHPAISDANTFVDVQTVIEDEDKYTLILNQNIDEHAKTTLWKATNQLSKNSVPLIKDAKTTNELLQTMSPNYEYAGSICNHINYEIPSTEDAEKHMITALKSLNEYFQTYCPTCLNLNSTITSLENKQPSRKREDRGFNKSAAPICERIDIINDSNQGILYINKKTRDNDLVRLISSPLAKKITEIKTTCKNDLKCVAKNLIITQNLTDNYLGSSGSSLQMKTPIGTKLSKITTLFNLEKNQRKEHMDQLLQLSMSSLSGIPLTVPNESGSGKRKMTTDEKLQILQDGDGLNSLKITLQPLDFDSKLHNESIFNN